MITKSYMRPIAYHRDIPHRLLLKNERGGWSIWTGDGDLMPIAIPIELARWIRGRPEMRQLPDPRMWFEQSSLPVDPTRSTRS